MLRMLMIIWTLYFSIGIASALSPSADGNVNTVATMLIFDKNMILVSDIAKTRAANANVKTFASMVRSEHGASLHAYANLLRKYKVTPGRDDNIVALLKTGDSDVANLNQLSGPAFDAGWIDIIIKDHAAMLTLIDDNLLKNTNDPAVLDALKKSRQQIETHLEQAHALRNNISL